jgi:hypothetical protein
LTAWISARGFNPVQRRQINIEHDLLSADDVYEAFHGAGRGEVFGMLFGYFGHAGVL